MLKKYRLKKNNFLHYWFDIFPINSRQLSDKQIGRKRDHDLSDVWFYEQIQEFCGKDIQ